LKLFYVASFLWLLFVVLYLLQLFRGRKEVGNSEDGMKGSFLGELSDTFHREDENDDLGPFLSQTTLVWEERDTLKVIEGGKPLELE
jgi:hypothetical protein